MKKLLFFVTLLLAGIVLAACGSTTGQTDASPTTTPLPNIFVAEGHLVPQDHLVLAFTVRGQVDEILVTKGQQVTAGQVLVRLADQEQAQAALAGAQLEQIAADQAYNDLLRTTNLAHAQAWKTYIEAQQLHAATERVWEKLDLNAIEEEISNAQADVNSRKVDLEDAQKEFDKFKDLAEANTSRKTAEAALTTARNNYNEALRVLAESTNKRDLPQAALNVAVSAESEAKRNYENTLGGAAPDALALLKARVIAADAQVAAALNLLDSYELKAPFSGSIADIIVSVGQQIGPETWAISLADFSQWYVDTSDLSELDVVKLEVGQQVDVSADALPGQTMPGTVEEIGQTPKSQAGDILYTVRIRIKDVDARLRWGMTVEVTFPDK
jgi:multidrug resistance efflux pump